MLRVILGDETGKVKAFMKWNKCIQENKTIVIFNAIAKMIDNRIEIQLMHHTGRVDLSRNGFIREVDEDNYISQKEWD